MNAPVCLKAVNDADKIEKLAFEVPESLYDLLDDQSMRIEKIDPGISGKERARAARKEGCLCSVAKGVSQRKMDKNRIFLPSSEISRVEGGVRISSFKTTIADVPEGVKIKGANFIADLDGKAWLGELEVVA